MHILDSLLAFSAYFFIGVAMVIIFLFIYSRLFRLGRDCTGDSVTRFCWCQTLYARIKRKNY